MEVKLEVKMEVEMDAPILQPSTTYFRPPHFQVTMVSGNYIAKGEKLRRTFVRKFVRLSVCPFDRTSNCV